jgi:hypothetical protein
MGYTPGDIVPRDGKPSGNLYPHFNWRTEQ